MKPRDHWFSQDNPLLRHLPIYDNVGDVCAAITYNPLAGLDVGGLSQMQRLALLYGDKEPLCPTSTSLRLAITLISMVRVSLSKRNPRLAPNRRALNQMLRMSEKGEPVHTGPARPGAALLVVEGITGTSKSVSAKLALQAVGPQRISHGEEPDCWAAATQLVWLFVGMSHDGSRGGLLTAILIAIDEQLGTEHATELPRRFRAVHALSGAVIALLHRLYVGALVIDEIQLRNMVSTFHAEEMQLFLLNLTNSGIPLILIGNPTGFSWLPVFSQNLTRAVERPQIYFHPCGAHDPEDDEEWLKLFQGVRSYYVLDNPPSNLAHCSSVLKRCSGGIGRLALALWCNAQAAALLEGRTSICAADIEAAYRDDAFCEVRPIADGFAQRDPVLLWPWRETDIPVDYYARVWKRPVPSEAELDVAPETNMQDKKPAKTAKAKKSLQQKDAARFKASVTRQQNNNRRRRSLRETLPPEDMRTDGLKKHAIASLDQLMQGIRKTTPVEGSHMAQPQSSTRGAS